MRLQDLAGWFPVDISWEHAPPSVEWRQLGSISFDEPFFFQTVARAVATEPGLAPLRTSIDVLTALGDAPGGEVPTGFLFHMSRCGSTLATRLLAASDRNLVLSEPDAVNKLLGAPPSFPRPLRTRCLRGLIRALDRRRERSQDHFFVKFSSWNVTEMRSIQEAFPGVPCCFLFRDPVEVMVSLLDEPPGWLTATLNFERARPSSPNTPRTAPEEHCARALAHFCRCALEAPDPNTLFVDYRSLPAAVWGSIASHFRVAFTLAEIERMTELARINAKDVRGVRKFEGDSTLKQSKASDLVREMAARWADEPIRQLRRRASGLGHEQGRMA